MLPLKYSVQLAWQIAADEAVRTNKAFIEPVDLLIGVCSVPKFLGSDSGRLDELKPATREGVLLEWQVIAGALERAGMDVALLRRAARQSSRSASKADSPSPKISRSESTRQIFESADRMTRNAGATSIDLRQLFICLLESDEQGLQQVMKSQGTGALAKELREAQAIYGVDLEQALVSGNIDASSPPFSRLNVDSDSKRKLALLYELPLQLGAEADLSSLLNRIVEKMLEVTSGANHGALLVRDRKTDQLLLKAWLPRERPFVSLTLAERAVQGKEGLIWRRDVPGTIPSLAEDQSEAGMYAPLLWQGRALGVLCLGTRKVGHVFQTDDLQLLVAVAHYAAMAVANHELQEELRTESTLLKRMLTNFSPRVQKVLLERAARGKLALGGERSEVTILFSDIRGFTKLASSMPADDVGDMLNDFFPVLVEALFRYNGAVDKFIGDAILAVFGSPEPDPNQYTNAVQAAWDMQCALSALNKARSSKGQVICEMGIAIHCGEVLHGFIGTRDRMEFTVVGDPVNRTARYCAGAQPGEILISPDLHQRVWRSVEVEPCTISTKHEGDFAAFRVKRCKPLRTT